MKRKATHFLLILLIILQGSIVKAQCLAGTTTANLNWDYLDYLVTTGNYSGFVTVAMSQSQNFAIGPERLNIAVAPTNVTIGGENTSHTAEAGSYGTGADALFTTTTSAARTITLTFDNNVNNLRFSLYDLDNNQRVTVSATNAVGIPQLVTLTRPAGSTVLILLSPGLAPTAQGAGSDGANSVTGTLNVDIAAAVKTVTLSFDNNSNDFWLSDIRACVSGSFPVDYFTGIRPYTGQPTYIIGTSDTNTVSLINVATGQAKMIFQDASSPRYINGLAYDHIRHDLYYVIDFTSSPSTNKMIKRYNFDSGIIDTFVTDITTLGIPTFNRGVESAGCAFYDGALYFGIEGNRPGNSSGRETIIWRIDIDASGNPTTVSQAHGYNSDNGSGTLAHDWGDFAIADSILVDFNSASSSGQSRYIHYNLHTGAQVANYPTTSPAPRQTGIIWNDQMYWVYDSIALYNGNGTLAPRVRITGATVLDWTGFCGDATGFRPKSDFGDAPATYDPDPLSPALHDMDTALRLGGTWDQEFVKTSSALANADGADEDGISFIPVLSTSQGNYLATITVYNNKGANATLNAWLDFDGDGIFDPAEGITQVVTSSASPQSKFLFWPSISSSLPNGTYIYLRVRITTGVMTTSNPTGYYTNGEVEDYRVLVDDYPLGVNLLTFDAKAEKNKTVKLSWRANEEPGFAGYDVERSADAGSWTKIKAVNANGLAGVYSYESDDVTPLKGTSYYRLKLKQSNGSFRYSELRTINLTDILPKVILMPNPAKTNATVFIYAPGNTEANISVLSYNGIAVHSKTVQLVNGVVEYDLPLSKGWPTGVYVVRVNAEGLITNKQLIIRR